jgi:hypothetical protein
MQFKISEQLALWPGESYVRGGAREELRTEALSGSAERVALFLVFLAGNPTAIEEAAKHRLRAGDAGGEVFLRAVALMEQGEHSGCSIDARCACKLSRYVAS